MLYVAVCHVCLVASASLLLQLQVLSVQLFSSKYMLSLLVLLLCCLLLKQRTHNQLALIVKVSRCVGGMGFPKQLRKDHSRKLNINEQC